MTPALHSSAPQFSAPQPNQDINIHGYASLFGVSDLSGDRVMKGAFAGSLLSRGDEPLPMLFGHETGEPIGVWDRVVEDTRGLFVAGRILAGSDKSDRTARLVTQRALSGLSIGYRVKRMRPRSSLGVKPGRDLLELDLWEISIVAFPMLRSARLTFTPNPS